MMHISGKTRVCGVIGDPVEHTLSPTIHNAAFRHLDLDFVFLSFRVKARDLPNAIRSMRSLGIIGLNVTMPHKNTVIRYLDELDPNVKLLGSANTILNKNGRLSGFNTDGFGAVRALRENDTKLSGEKVLLLGAGGAAKSIAFALAKEVGELVILNRSKKKAEKLAETLWRASEKKVFSDSLSREVIARNIQDSNILINATSVGMYPEDDQSIILPHLLKHDLTVMDIVYNPFETKLAKDAKAKSAKVISGIEMLIYQAAASFEIWTGCSAPIEVMRKAAINRLSKSGESE